MRIQSKSMISRGLRRSLIALTIMTGSFGSVSALAANGSVAYSYDALGRVTTASYDTGVCIVYAYDANGNRTSETVNLGTAATPTWGTAVWGCFNWSAGP